MHAQAQKEKERERRKVREDFKDKAQKL